LKTSTDAVTSAVTTLINAGNERSEPDRARIAKAAGIIIALDAARIYQRCFPGDHAPYRVIGGLITNNDEAIAEGSQHLMRVERLLTDVTQALALENGPIVAARFAIMAIIALAHPQAESMPEIVRQWYDQAQDALVFERQPMKQSASSDHATLAANSG